MAFTRASLLQTLLVAATATPLVAGCGGKTSDATDTTTGPGGGGGTSGTSGQGGGPSSTGGADTGTGGTSVSAGGAAGAAGAGATIGVGGTSSGSAGSGAAGSNGSGGAGAGGGISAGGAAGGGGGKIACDDPVPVLVGGQETGFVTCANGVLVRAEAKVCPDHVDPSKACNDGPPIPGECNTSADCTGSPHAYCHQFTTSGSCACIKGCVQDSDCAPDHICQCGEPVGHCVPATCHTNADCPEGSCAQLDLGEHECISSAFSCQTKDEACQTDEDCLVSGHCHAEDLGYPRSCDPTTCAVGRPLVVEQAWRQAALVTGVAWG